VLAVAAGVVVLRTSSLTPSDPQLPPGVHLSGQNYSGVIIHR
jgi:hypothetical protein